jgi:integrase
VSGLRWADLDLDAKRLTASSYYAVDVGRDPQTGRRKLKSKGRFRTRNEAERALAEVISEVSRGTFAEPTKRTVAEFLREWLVGGKSRGLRLSTLVGYEVAIERWLIPRLGSLPLAQLTPGHLNTAYSELMESGRVQGEGGLSPRTVRIAHSVIRRALKDGVKWGKLTRNVADAADPPSTARAKADARKRMRVWTPAQLRRFLRHTKDDRLYALWLLAASTGMRRGELLGLRWADLDLDAKRLTITRALIAPKYELQFSEPKTDAGRRSIALDDATVAALRAHHRRQLKERLAFGPGWGEHPLADDLIYRDEAGWPLVPMIVTQRFQTLAKQAGLPVIRLHDLRHGMATMALLAGVHPKVVSERLGHSNIAVTLDTYTAVVPSLQEEAAECVAALVFGAE